MRGIAQILFAAGSVSIWAPLPASPQVIPTELSLSVAIEREIRGGETHQYRVPAARGQFIHVVADQRGADIELVLRAPDGREIFRSDLPKGSHGPESVLTIA